jgi:RNase adaptor protein for sRNA GlmZ degradation
LKKTVHFYSFGHAFPKYYPKAPKNRNTRQFVFDVRDMVAETFNKSTPDSGLEEEMRKIVVGGCKKNGYLSGLQTLIRKSVLDLAARRSNEHQEIRFYFGCAGGWQRSVALAEYFKAYCETILSGSESLRREHLIIKIRHLTINQWKKK